MGTTAVHISGAKTAALRWQFPFVLLISVIVAYMDRMKISYALPKIAADYGWTVQQTGKYGGLLMSIFFLGYGLSNIFLSPLAERFGPRKSLLFIITAFSIICIFQAPLGLIFAALLVTRFFLGVAEGTHFPMMNALTKVWFPPFERSRANAIWLCGMTGAMIIAPWIVVPIIETWSWRWMFVVLGGIGLLIVLPLIAWFIYDSPNKHPRISPEEIKYIESNLETDVPDRIDFWGGAKYFMRLKTFWLCTIASTLSNIAAFGTLSWLPTYFTEARQLPFSDLVYAASIPYVFSIVGLLLWAWLGDRTNRRNLIAATGSFLAGAAVIGAAFLPDTSWVIAMFSIAIFFQVSNTAGGFVVVQRILPASHVATGVGFFNGIAMLVGGGLGPLVVGGVVSATGDYTAGILSLVIVSWMTGAVQFWLSRILKY